MRFLLGGRAAGFEQAFHLLGGIAVAPLEEMAVRSSA
jgi:hypothetical protein